MRAKANSSRPSGGKRNASKRNKVALSRRLEKHLLAYAVAGTGLAIASASVPADAQIVYTPSNIPLAQPGFGQHVFTTLDINNDGVTDFRFAAFYSTHCSWVSGTFPDGASSCWAVRSLKISPIQAGNGEISAPLPKGVPVGSSGTFGSQSVLLAGSQSQWAFRKPKADTDTGLWQGIQYAYLGLKFVVNGEVHYGWARIKFDYPAAFSSGVHKIQGMFTGTISGYAYQATPNQPIITGQTSDNNNAALSNAETPANMHTLHLGLLAAGSQGVTVWRSSTLAAPATETK